MAHRQPPTDEDLQELANWIPVAVLGFLALIFLGFAWQVDRARTSGYGRISGLPGNQHRLVLD
jgi:hypothetical protein